MADPKNIEDVRALLKEGKVQEADDLLQSIAASDAKAAFLLSGKPAEPPPPRDPDIILHDFMVTVADRFGNHEVLEQLAAEFQGVMNISKVR